MQQPDHITAPSAQAAAAAPLVTVLTVVYNAAAQIRETVASVRPFVGPEVEYVVVDGGSTDGTLDLLRAEADGISTLVSEPDQGIYDAMNKGAGLARGRFLLHLNVGDRLLDLPLALLREQPADVACVAGRVRLGSGRVFVPSVGWTLRLHNTLHHQGCFYAREGLPPYDLRYRVFADFDLNQRLVRTGRRIVVADTCVASHDEGGVSHRSGRFAEVYDIIASHHGWPWVAASWLYFKWRGLARRMTAHAA